MATLSKPVGYECEFVDQVPQDYFCKQCKHVAREPIVTTCCTEAVCKACIDAVIQDKKPCPSCQETGISYFPHKKYQPKILALKVHCTMKDRGCEWTGQLQHLDAHLDVTTGDCTYVDIDCPSDCNQKVQKRNVDAHLTKECPNRDSICPHCSLRGTFREVSEHFEVCRYYPLVCPNRCGATFERDDLEDHMKLCGLVKVQCDFSYAGCQAEFLRDNQEKHMEQNTQRHLALMAAATLRITQEQQQTFEQKLQEQQEVFEKKLGEQQKEFREQLQERDKQTQQAEQKLVEQLEQKDKQIKQVEEKKTKEYETLQQQVQELRLQVRNPPYDITISNFRDLKAKKLYIDSLPMYAQSGMYKFFIRLWPNGIYEADSTHVSLRVYSHKSDHDDKLKFPVKFTMTVQLLNQFRDQDHIIKDVQCEVTRERIGKLISPIGADNELFSLAQSENRENTQYLNANCIKICVTKIVMRD